MPSKGHWHIGSVLADLGGRNPNLWKESRTSTLTSWLSSPPIAPTPAELGRHGQELVLNERMLDHSLSASRGVVGEARGRVSNHVWEVKGQGKALSEP